MCRLPVCKLGGVGRIGTQLNRTRTYIAREKHLDGTCSIDRGCEQHNSAFFVGPEFNRGFRFMICDVLSHDAVRRVTMTRPGKLR